MLKLFNEVKFGELVKFVFTLELFMLSRTSCLKIFKTLVNIWQIITSHNLRHKAKNNHPTIQGNMTMRLWW